MKGKIICINKFIHTVLLDNGDVVDCIVRGKLRNENVFTLVGDYCLVDIANKTIEKIYKRRNSLDRPMVANIDKLLIVSSTTIPAFSTYLIDKFLIISYSNNIEPIIIVTKTDKLKFKEKLDIKKYVNYYKKIGIKVYYNYQIKKIKKEFDGVTVALCGQTGSGKSTLLNRIDKSLKLKTDEVSLALGRGKHTTRLVELLKIGNGLVADTPGFSSVTLDIKKEDIRKYYKDFVHKCKYKSCLHDKEEGCYIKKLVKKNVIKKFRYDNYIKLLGEGK